MSVPTIRRIAATIVLSLPLAAAQAEAGGPLANRASAVTPELKARLASADLAAGARYFERKCSQCHDGEKTGGHAKGPFLWNVFGRKAGSIPGFDFSPAMKQANTVWDFATLDYYLADTERAVPGRAMNFTGIADAALRAAVVVHVSRLGDAPPPLPQ